VPPKPVACSSAGWAARGGSAELEGAANSESAAVNNAEIAMYFI
jgi:hypothetical protein